MLQNCGVQNISLPQFQSVPGFKILICRDGEKIVYEQIALGVGCHTRLIFALMVFAALSLSESLTHSGLLWATTSLVPSRWLRFRMWRHLSSLSGELSGVFALGSKPSPLTRIAWTGLETWPSSRLTSHFTKDWLSVFLKYKRSLKIIS